jgi:uncharacterized peroxidase-related enzyme
MTRFTTVDPATAQGKSKELLDAVKSKLGIVPNMTRVMANSPVVLEGYLNLSGIVSGGNLQATLREKIALRTAQFNGCEYCLSAHTAIGGSLKIDDEQIIQARSGTATDPSDAAVLSFVDAVLETQGGVSDAQLEAIRTAGFGDEQIGEIIANVVVNLFTNYFNRAAQTDVDFPLVEKDLPAAANA